MAKEGYCQLCDKYGPLNRESHIIPKFLFRAIGDVKNRINYTNVTANYTKNEIINWAFYNEYIFCSDCEVKVLGRLDTFAATIFYNRFKTSLNDIIISEGNRDSDYTLLFGVDNLKFKLFLLSVLLRANISSHKFYEEIVLQPECVTQLKRILLKRNCNPEEVFHVFSTLIYGIIWKENSPFRMIPMPHIGKRVF